MKSAVEILSALVAIPSVNPMGGDVDPSICFEGRVSDWLEAFFSEIGAEYERVTVSGGRDNIVARHTGRQGKATVLLDAHQDTVPVDGMTISPFQPVIREGRLYGRGACDVKGGMAAMLHAFRRLVLESPPESADVILSCTCDEESTTTGINHLISGWSGRESQTGILQRTPDFAVVAEPTELDVVVAHRGVTRFRIRTRGRACHSSDPSQGVNAIYRMARVVALLEDYAAQLGETVPPHPLCGGATLSVGRVIGGTSVNIVPDECVVEIDRRVIPGEKRSRVVPDIQEFLDERLEFDVEYEPPWIESPPLVDEDNDRLASTLVEIASGLTEPRSIVGVPYGTHASRTCAAGVPSVVFGPGSIEQAHTKDEFIDLKQVELAAEAYYQLCCTPVFTAGSE